MKSRICTWIAAISLFAALAMPALLVAQERAIPSSTRTFDTTPSSTWARWEAASASPMESTTTDRSTDSPRCPATASSFLSVSTNGAMTDLGTLGGPNSESFANLNNAIQVAGTAETSMSDPNGEDFCAFGTNLICLGFVWQDGMMTPLEHARRQQRPSRCHQRSRSGSGIRRNRHR